MGKVATLYIACLNGCNAAAATLRSTQLSIKAARDGEAPAPTPETSTPQGLAVGSAPAPVPVASPAASPVGSPAEDNLYPAHRAQWEHHEHRMAKSDHLLIK